MDDFSLHQQPLAPNHALAAKYCSYPRTAPNWVFHHRVHRRHSERSIPRLCLCAKRRDTQPRNLSSIDQSRAVSRRGMWSAGACSRCLPRELARACSSREQESQRWRSPARHYCVTVFTASPTLNPAPETGAATAEMSSTSVTRTTPTGEVRRRITAPVEGSLISLVILSTDS